MKWIIDSREQSQTLFESIETLAIEKDFDWSVELLDCGDILIDDAIIIERKEASDFISSIIDHRLTEQCKRMKIQYPDKKKYVIVEGDLFATGRAIHPHAILAKLVSIIEKYEVNLIQVQNEWQTIYTSWVIANRVENKETLGSHNGLIKMLNFPPFVRMLYQIEGLGEEKCVLISNYYNNSFAEFYNTVSIKELKQFPKIGDMLAKRILDFFEIKR